MPIDFNKYRKFVDDLHISEEEKRELVQTVGRIMESFVDQAFDGHSVELNESYLAKANLQSKDKTLDSKNSRLKNCFRDETSLYLKNFNEAG